MKKILNIFLLLTGISYSQSNLDNSPYYNIEYDLKPHLISSKFKTGILFSLGAGRAIDPKHFVISPTIIWELHKHINIASGIDIYFPTDYHSGSYSINVIPYYSLRIGKISDFRIGAGIAIWDKNIMSIVSTKFDFELFHNNFVGIELKSLILIPFPADNGPPLMPILLNYSIKF